MAWHNKQQQVRGSHVRANSASGNSELRSVQANRSEHQTSPSQHTSLGSEYAQAYAEATKKKRSGKQRFWRVVFVLALIIFLGALAVLGVIAYQYLSQQNAYNDLEQYTELGEGENLSLSDLKVDWEGLRAINPDIVAWIYIPGSPINYPVVQGSDNNEYLHKAFDGSTGWLASAGTIFLDANNNPSFSDRNNALYGHHMRDGSMFATIADWTDQSEFNAHRDIYLLTPAGNYRCMSFALVKTTGTDSIVQTSFASAESYQRYIQDKLERSVVTQKGTVLATADIQQSLMLSTCEYTQNDGRAVLCAAVVETTVAHDPYVAATERGTTGLSAVEGAEVGRDYKEAA